QARKLVRFGNRQSPSSVPQPDQACQIVRDRPIVIVGKTRAQNVYPRGRSHHPLVCPSLTLSPGHLLNLTAIDHHGSLLGPYLQPANAVLGRSVVSNLNAPTAVRTNVKRNSFPEYSRAGDLCKNPQCEKDRDSVFLNDP